jgi:ABC-type transport system substrate-binding protein
VFVANGKAMLAAAIRPVAALLVLALLAGCRGGEAQDPPLRVDAVSDRAQRLIVADAVSAGLTARDSRGQVIPGLAQSWRVSDDGMGIVFRLRAATFVGGRTVTAADVVASIERARSGRAGPLARDLLAGVTEVNAPLDDVVELRLSTPQPELLELLATPPLAVRSRVGRETAGAFLAGPEPRAERPGAPLPDGLRLTRNPRFYAAETVALAAVTVRSFDPDAAIARFNRGETDLVLGGGLEGLASVRIAARPQELELEQPRASLLLLVNRRIAGLDNPGVRRALALAIDRQGLGRAIFGSSAAAAVQALSPSNLAGYAPPQPSWGGAPFVGRQEEARRLLGEAGYDNVNPLRLKVAIRQSRAEARLLERVAADLDVVGVELSLVQRDEAGHRRALASGDFDLALVQRDTPVDSPLPFLLPFLCERNRHGVCLPEADRKLAESWSAPTRAARLAALAEAERLWVEDGAAIGLVQPLGWALRSQRIQGFAPNPGGSHSLRHISIDPTRRLLP